MTEAKRVFRYPKQFRYLMGALAIVCVTVALVQSTRQQWPQVTIYSFFTLAASIFYWLSSFKITYGPDELKIENYFYLKVIPIVSIRRVNYVPAQNSLLIIFGEKNKRSSFAVLGKEMVELASILQEESLKILRPEPNIFIEYKLSKSAIAQQLYVIAISVVMFALMIGYVPTIYKKFSDFMDAIVLLGAVLLMISPFILVWMLFTSIKEKFKISALGMEVNGRTYSFQDLKSIEFRGLLQNMTNLIKLEFNDETIVKINLYIINAHPYLVDQFMEITHNNPKLIASAERGLKKNKIQAIATMILAALVLLVIGLGMESDLRKLKEKHSALAQHGVAVVGTAIKSENGAYETYNYTYDNKSYSFPLSNECKISKDSINLKVLPENPALHEFSDSPVPRGKDGNHLVIISVILLGLSGVLFFKPIQSFDQIYQRRKSMFKKA